MYQQQKRYNTSMDRFSHRSVGPTNFYPDIVPPIRIDFYHVAADKLVNLTYKKWRQVLLNGVDERSAVVSSERISGS